MQRMPLNPASTPREKKHIKLTALVIATAYTPGGQAHLSDKRNISCNFSYAELQIKGGH